MSTVKPFIISVTGAHSRVGKTTLCSILLKELKGFGAIKFTKRPQRTKHPLPNPPPSRGRAGVGGGTPNSLLIDDLNILNHKGKDTSLFLEAGARRVLWIQSPSRSAARQDNGLEYLLKVAISRMRDLQGVIIEGNSPVDFITPSLIIFIIREKGEIKPSAIKISEKADIVIINSEKRISERIRTKKKIPSLSVEGRKGKKVFWIDLIRKKGEIDEFLYFVKERINKNPH